jgi:sporulation protein YlmC with PRC-barrel domain
MNRTRKAIAVASVFIFCLIGTAAYAKEKGNSYELRDLLWSRVENLRGEYLGIVSNFVIDSKGQVSLAIIDRSSTKANEPEKSVAVPFSALSWKSKGDYFVLNIGRLMLADSPPFNKDKDLSNRAFTAKVYEFYGLRPSWTEKAPSPYDWGGEAQDF